MVRLLGFEPRTSWSVVKRSVQLSYKRKFKEKILYLLKFVHDINRYHNLKRMHLISNINFFKKNFLSIVLALVPFSFIAGNMIININIIMLILSTILIANRRLLNIKFHLFDILLITFFFLIIFTGLINDILVLNKLSWGTD